MINNHSQYNEELFVNEFFRGKNCNFLVDIGAADGLTNSNSRLFLEKGWYGLLVEPNKNNFEKLKILYDENNKVILENLGVSNKTIHDVDFYVDQNDKFEQLSTFSDTQAQRCKEYFKCDFLCLKSDLVKTSELFEKHSISKIDFLSIDTESFDTNVILGINFDTVSIELICVEHITKDLTNYLEKHLYSKVYETIGNHFYAKQ